VRFVANDRLGLPVELHIFFTTSLDHGLVKLIFIFEVLEDALPFADQKFAKTLFEIAETDCHVIVQIVFVGIDFVI
jgi:hypothetical protein